MMLSGSPASIVPATATMKVMLADPTDSISEHLDELANLAAIAMTVLDCQQFRSDVYSVLNPDHEALLEEITDIDPRYKNVMDSVFASNGENYNQLLQNPIDWGGFDYGIVIYVPHVDEINVNTPPFYGIGTDVDYGNDSIYEYIPGYYKPKGSGSFQTYLFGLDGNHQSAVMKSQDGFLVGAIILGAGIVSQWAFGWNNAGDLYMPDGEPTNYINNNSSSNCDTCNSYFIKDFIIDNRFDRTKHSEIWTSYSTYYSGGSYNLANAWTHGTPVKVGKVHKDDISNPKLQQADLQFRTYNKSSLT